MATFAKFNVFVENLAEGVHNLQTGTIKMMLTNTAPSAANTVKTDITEISAGSGYSAGGLATSVVSSSQTSGVYALVLADIVMNTTGSVGPFRYCVLYNDTPTSPADPLILYGDFGAIITVPAGEAFTIDLSQANGLLRLT